jgi:hypothetical protein
MATYTVRVAVDYLYEVEADSKEDAEAEGWKYEDYKMFAQVDFIKVEEQQDEEGDDDTEEEEVM